MIPAARLNVPVGSTMATSKFSRKDLALKSWSSMAKEVGVRKRGDSLKSCLATRLEVDDIIFKRYQEHPS